MPRFVANMQPICVQVANRCPSTIDTSEQVLPVLHAHIWTWQVAGLKDELDTERKKMADMEKSLNNKLASEATGTKNLEVH